jgi:hypothetical protein
VKQTLCAAVADQCRYTSDNRAASMKSAGSFWEMSPALLVDGGGAGQDTWGAGADTPDPN